MQTVIDKDHKLIGCFMSPKEKKKKKLFFTFKWSLIICWLWTNTITAM